MKRILVLAEGQTEERFVKTLLQPYLWGLAIHIEPTILVTKLVKKGPRFKGGITSYGQVKRDLIALLADSDAALVTTLFDLYGLPSDMPGYVDGQALAGATRARFLQRALHTALGAPQRFRPFLMVHEYEALLYCDTTETSRALGRPALALHLSAERNRFPGPEDINEGPSTHPADRISRHFPNYDKALHGPLIASNIGLGPIRRQCPHFDAWLRDLEQI